MAVFTSCLFLLDSFFFLFLFNRRVIYFKLLTQIHDLRFISASPGGALGLGPKEAKAFQCEAYIILFIMFLSKGFKETRPSGESRTKGADATNSEVCITLVTIGYSGGHYPEVIMDVD